MLHYTPEDLIRYLYKETSPEETAEIEQALQSNWTLREKMSVLKTSNERLNALIETPRTEVVLNVLKYAASKQKVTS
ncbi:MAG TPA: hypothetical protein VM843_06830 [Flavisolibacter sp.]|nr:hypothetical protein [Flavisolibacter sp.]